MKVGEKHYRSIWADSSRKAVHIIDQSRLPHVFELFRRATTTGSGLGVGLAVVRALVEAHGGHIWINMEREVGTTVSFTLPVAEKI